MNFEVVMKQRIMSGMRPTGKLHLGHYLGVIDSWVNLQDDYECFFQVADWHALTTKYDKTENLKQGYTEMGEINLGLAELSLEAENEALLKTEHYLTECE